MFAEHNKVYHLGGEEPSDSNGFFCPIVGFFKGGFRLLPGPIEDAAEASRELNC